MTFFLIEIPEIKEIEVATIARANPAKVTDIGKALRDVDAKK